MRISRRDVLAGSAALALSGRVVAQQPRPAPAPRLGINLSGPMQDWNTEQAFANTFRLSRPWNSQRRTDRWGDGPTLELDEYGWIKRLEPNCRAVTRMCTIDGGHYPSGRYTVLYDGEGDISFFPNRVRVVSDKRGRMEIDVDSSSSGFTLRLNATNPDDYVRNVRVIMPGLETDNDAAPFRPDFVQRWQGIACLRFMDWMQTNDSEIVSWSQRSTPDHARYAEHGVDAETMIDLANRLNADPWFCIPHQADDEYVRNFARLVGERLNPNLRAWVEYSNEVWNNRFAQYHHAARMAEGLGFSGQERARAGQYTAYRSKQIFAIWESELGRDGRVVRVLASQAGSRSVTERILSFEDAHQSADVLAVAPYMMFNVAAEGEGITESVVENWSVEQAVDYMVRNALPGAIEMMERQKEFADRYGLKLVAYEAGQHMVGVGRADRNQAVTKVLTEANAHPAMGDLYRRYYDAWTDVGGDLLCAFDSVSGWGRSGSWGLMEYPDGDPADYPKYQASLDWARRCGQEMG